MTEHQRACFICEIPPPNSGLLQGLYRTHKQSSQKCLQLPYCCYVLGPEPVESDTVSPDQSGSTRQQKSSGLNRKEVP